MPVRTVWENRLTTLLRRQLMQTRQLKLKDGSEITATLASMFIASCVRDAIMGDNEMRKLIWDRIDGKVPQGILTENDVNGLAALLGVDPRELPEPLEVQFRTPETTMSTSSSDEVEVTPVFDVLPAEYFGALPGAIPKKQLPGPDDVFDLDHLPGAEE